MPALISVFLVLTILCLSGAGIFFFIQISLFVKTPVNPEAGEQIFFIKPGQSLKTIAINLEKKALISSKTYFKVFTKLKKADKKLQAGEYILSASNSPGQILEILLKGRVKLYRMTIPEGKNIQETAAIVESAGFCPKETFVRLCHDDAFIQSFDVRSTSLEGYLFPDTYFFPRHSSCEDIIITMVKHFQTVFTTEWQQQAKKLGFSVDAIVTLASIVEKETGDASERPVIASVFHNRLKKNMRLESDPTVIYGIKNFNGNIQRRHLKMLTPYNTYQIKGLPLGPIANPGALSLQAALYPARTDYLFFVSKKNGTHQFSKTIRQHNQAVRKYQLRKK